MSHLRLALLLTSLAGLLLLLGCFQRLPRPEYVVATEVPTTHTAVPTPTPETNTHSPTGVGGHAGPHLNAGTDPNPNTGTDCRHCFLPRPAAAGLQQHRASGFGNRLGFHQAGRPG